MRPKVEIFDNGDDYLLYQSNGDCLKVAAPVSEITAGGEPAPDFGLIFVTHAQRGGIGYSSSWIHLPIRLHSVEKNRGISNNSMRK